MGEKIVQIIWRAMRALYFESISKGHAESRGFKGAKSRGFKGHAKSRGFKGAC